MSFRSADIPVLTRDAATAPTSPTSTITVRVYGTPKGQPRPRAFARKMGNGSFAARVYDAGTAEGWKADIAMAMRQHLPATPISGSIRFDMTLLFARPARLSRKKDPTGRIPHNAKPDVDNASKAVMDALTQIGLWADDAMVCDHRTQKFYAAVGERPGAELSITLIDGSGPAAAESELFGVTK